MPIPVPDMATRQTSDNDDVEIAEVDYLTKSLSLDDIAGYKEATITTSETKAIANDDDFSLKTETVCVSAISYDNIKVRATPSPLSLKPSSTPVNTGRVHNLTVEQRMRLFQLWGMILEYLSQPYDPIPTKKKKEDTLQLLEYTLRKSHEQLDWTFTEKESTAFESNPLTVELFNQSSTEDLDRMLLRFLRARKWVVIDAFNMLTDSLKWRFTSNIRKMLLEGDKGIKPSLLEGGMNYFWKTDKDGRLLCYVRSRLHDKNAQTIQESIDFTIFTVEVGRRLRVHDEQLVTVLFDLRNAPLSSLDLPVLQFMVQALESFYPEILGKCLILEAPWIFSGFWKLVKPLLDPVVASKIEFVKLADLPSYINEKDLPVEYGGSDEFTYRYIFPDPSEYSCSLENDDDAHLLLTRIEVLKSRLIESTREMYSLITRVEDPSQLEFLLSPIKERRDQIKQQLGECYKMVDLQVLPRNFYNRIGVLGIDGSVDWSRYCLPDPPGIRKSAPPMVPTHNSEPDKN